MPADQAATAAAAQQTVTAFLATDTMARDLGVTVSQVAPGRVSAHLTVTGRMLNGHGGGHGSAVFAVADIAFAMACNSFGHPAVGRSCSIEFLRPAFEGDELVATAAERSRDGRTAVYDVTVRRAADQAVLAEMRAVSRMVPDRPAVN